MGFAIAILVAFLQACQTKPEKVLPPANIIQKEQMIQILADMHIEEAESHLGRIPRAVQDSMALMGYYEVLEKHQLTREEYEESFDWYAYRPEVMQTLYDDVIARVQEKESEFLEKEKELEPPTEDGENPAVMKVETPSSTQKKSE